MINWRSAIVAVALISVVGLVLTPALCDRTARTTFVDIDHYEEVHVAFDSGDSVRITVMAKPYDYPISVFLLKGEEARTAWIESEEVDLEAIRAGEGVPEQNTTFQVISPFSRRNVTSFDSSITLGEHDDYYVIIALYRDKNMSADDILNEMSTMVEYEVEWEVMEKNVPWSLLLIAIIFVILGAVLIILYFWRSGKEDIEDEEPREHVHYGRERTAIRRAPPGPDQGASRAEANRGIKRAPPRRPPANY